jgi:hypothetical protein
MILIKRLNYVNQQYEVFVFVICKFLGLFIIPILVHKNSDSLLRIITAFQCLEI